MNDQKIWQDNLDLIKKSVSSKVYDTWFKDLKVKSISDNRLVLFVPNSFYENWIREKYYKTIIKSLSTITKTSMDNWEIDFSIKENDHENFLTEVKEKEIKQPPAPTNQKKYSYLDSNINARYTFDNFVVGSCNQFAHAASLAVVKNPGKSYNPLFIYGGSGLGKTHLIHAIGNILINKGNNLNILYLNSEKFTNELINSIRNDKMENFRQKYRNIDVLLIDDIQFLARKERTQEEFFYTFNSLYDLDKQIIITSDRFPKDISDIEERLRSRFEWGLIADIQVPDLETRIAILKSKSLMENMNLDDDILMFLAQNIKNNVRELEGCLTRLIAFSSFTGEALTIDLAKKILKDVISESVALPSIEKIQKIVSVKLQVKVSDIKSKKRTKSLIFPRQLAMYVSREVTNLSFPDIGNGFGGKDHTTVMHACKQFAKKIETDVNAKMIYESILMELKK